MRRRLRHLLEAAKDLLFVKVAVKRARAHLIDHCNVSCLKYLSQERMFQDDLYSPGLHVIVRIGVKHLFEFGECVSA